jgi:hypothetical protein
MMVGCYIRGGSVLFLTFDTQTDSRFYFSCFNPADTNDLRAGLVNGELGIPGSIIRQNVFDPVIDEVRGIQGVLCTLRNPYAMLTGVTNNRRAG